MGLLDERGEGAGHGGKEPAPGTQVAGFTLQECLATGSSGSVYRAERGGRRFALKLVPMGHWGEREVDALRRVRHTSVVGLLGYGQWPEDVPRFLVLTLEWVDGAPLDEWARDNPCTAQQWVERVLLPVVDALGQVHAAGVVHRDVKEANIVMRREDGRPVLVDFGAAVYQGAPRLTLRLPPGTPEYRSPEMWRFAREWEGEPYESRPADDLWALGVMLYALLTRTLPFGDRHGPLARTILEHAPEAPHARNPRVPRALGEVCLRMLEKAPEARYTDAPALALTLREALARADDTWSVPLFAGPSAPTHAEPQPGPPSPGGDWRRPLVLGLLAIPIFLAGPRPRVLDVESTAPRPGLSMPSPSRQAGFGRELADTAKTAEVGSRVELLQSPPPSPVPPSHREDEPMRKLPPARSLMKSTLVSAACVGAACVSAPPARPPLPPAECPPGSEQTLRRFGIGDSQYHMVILVSADEAIQSSTKTITVEAGPWHNAVTMSRWMDLPDQARLHGVLYFKDKRVHGRFTQIELRTGETFPVCMMLSAGHYQGIDMEPGSRPGKAIINVFAGVVTVERFN